MLHDAARAASLPAGQGHRVTTWPTCARPSSPTSSPAASCINAPTSRRWTQRLAAGTLTAYIGFDCTGRQPACRPPGQIMLLRRLQQAGHRPIVLMGGGTTKVGDPSGKDESAPAARARPTSRTTSPASGRVFERFLEFGDGPNDAIMVDNADWLDRLQLHPVPARFRPALLDQPHADLGQRAGCGSSASSR